MPILLDLHHKHEYYFHSCESPKTKESVQSDQPIFLTICEQLHTLLPKEPSALCLLGNNRVLQAMILYIVWGWVGLGQVESRGEVPTTKMGSRGDGIL